MDSNSKQLATIITQKVLKRKNEYQAVFEILFGDDENDLLDDSLLERSLSKLKSDDECESISYSNNDKIIDCALDEIYKASPDCENDNSILWDLLWLFGYEARIIGEFIYHLQRKGITNRELARAFGNEEDTPFQIIREVIGPQILKELTDEIKKNRMKDIDTVKYRNRIIRLLLHKISNDVIDCIIYGWSFKKFSSLLFDDFWIHQIEPKVYKINQWDCKTPYIIKTLGDIFHEVSRKDVISLKSMEFPFSPFYSVFVEALLNFETPQNIKKTLEMLKNKTIKDTTTRMEIVQEGIKSIREGEPPLVLLWNIGQKHEQLKESLNKMYNYPLFSKDIETKKWGKDVKKIIYKQIKNRNGLKAVKEVNFWILPLENIVDILMHFSIHGRFGGLLAVESMIPKKAFKSTYQLHEDNNPFQTEIQRTYIFLYYGMQMAIDGEKTDDIVYSMNYNASLIIQNLTNHFELVTYLFCKFTKGFNTRPVRLMVPENMLK